MGSKMQDRNSVSTEAAMRSCRHCEVVARMTSEGSDRGALLSFTTSRTDSMKHPVAEDMGSPPPTTEKQAVKRKLIQGSECFPSPPALNIQYFWSTRGH